MDKKYTRFYRLSSKTGYHILAIKILREEAGALTLVEILDKISIMRKLTGKTPKYTLSSSLQRSKLVERVGRGKYQLKEEYRNLDVEELQKKFTKTNSNE